MKNLLSRVSEIDYKKKLIYVLMIIFFTAAFSFNLIINNYQHFSYLAESFSVGKFHFLETPGSLLDTVYWNGQYYWPQAPFPAILLIPFVSIAKILGVFFYQGYLQFFITVGVFFLAYKLAKLHKFNQTDSLYLSFAFCFSSIYHLIAFVSWSWYFVQSITVFLLLYTINEYYHKQRYWLIGTTTALIFASRFTAGFGVLFFILKLVFDSPDFNLKQKTVKLIQLTVPIFLTGILLLTYNYARFENWFENGYQLANNAILSESDRYELLNHGLFKLSNIPTNFYYYFIKMPDPILESATTLWGNTYYLRFPYVKISYPGVNFFIVSPIFLLVLSFKVKTKENKLLWITIITILLFTLSYYWVGWRQTGPRYMLDVLPFLYVILLQSFAHRNLSSLHTAIIVTSCLVNFYFLITCMM